MKTIIFTLTLALTTFFTKAQSTNWAWAKSAGGTFFDYSQCIAVDGNGNSYVTGSFKSDSITFGSTTLPSNNASQNMFIVKYDQSGNVLWAKSAGGTSNNECKSIAVDGNGNFYITGWFNVGSFTFDSNILTNNGGKDIFIVKCAPSGNVLWAKSAGSTSDDEGKSITVDDNGNCYVTGGFINDSITFGSTTVTNNVGNGSTDMFIVKYDSLGNVQWAKSTGVPSSDNNRCISVDGSGNLFVTGNLDNNSITFGSTTLTNNGSNGTTDMFVVKYDSMGNVLWAKSAGGTDFDFSSSVAVDGSGNCYMTGSFSSNSITFGSTNLTANAGWDIFVVKYDPSGNVLWAKSAGGTSYVYANSIAVDSSGNSYITGEFSLTNFTLGSTTMTYNGDSDIFVVKFDPSGNVLWANSLGGNSSDSGNSIAVDGSGNSYVTGNFESSIITFGSTTLIQTANLGHSDIFVVKLGDCVAPTGTDVRTACNSFTWINGITYFTSNNTATYYIVGGATNGCDSLVTLNLTINTANTSVTPSGSSLSANASGASYQWLDCGNNFAVISGATNQTFAPTSSGNYAVEVTQNACTDTSSCYNVTLTGIVEINKNVRIDVIPNPFSSQTILQLDKNLSNATLSVENIFGQTVTEINNISGQRLTLQRNNLPAGVYFIRLKEDHKQIATKKILIID